MSAAAGEGGARMAPFHCPYCGEEDLHPLPPVPREDGAPSPGAPWECRGCARSFALTFLGLTRPGPAAGSPS